MLFRSENAMLPRSLASIVTAVLIGLAMAGSAQAKRLTADTFIQQWDEDHAGTLSLDEVKEAASARFDELDRIAQRHEICGECLGIGERGVIGSPSRWSARPGPPAVRVRRRG